MRLCHEHSANRVKMSSRNQKYQKISSEIMAARGDTAHRKTVPAGTPCPTFTCLRRDSSGWGMRSGIGR